MTSTSRPRDKCIHEFKCADNDPCKLQCSRMELEMMTGGFLFQGQALLYKRRCLVCFWCASQQRQERAWASLEGFYDIQALTLNLFCFGSSKIFCVCLFGFVCLGWWWNCQSKLWTETHEKRGLGVQEWTLMWFVYSLKANTITVGFYDSGLVLLTGRHIYANHFSNTAVCLYPTLCTLALN